MQIVKLEKRRNARDFGGIVNKEGKTIRPGMFMRTGKLDGLTEEEIRHLSEELKLKKIMDLRMEIECRKAPDSEIPGADWIPVRICTEAMAGITRDKPIEDEVERLANTPYMPTFYEMLVEHEECVRMLGEALHEMMRPVDGVTLWHCSEGKDRCGIVSALFLYLMDVEEDEIIRDYLVTNEVSIPRATRLKEHVLALGAAEEVAEKIFLSYQAKEEYLRAAIDSMVRRSGSVQGYIRDILGVTDEEKAEFQARVLM